MRTAFGLIVFLIVILVTGYFMSGTSVKHETSQGQTSPERSGHDRITYTFDGEPDAQGAPSPWQLKVSSGEAKLAVQSHPESAQEKVLWIRAEKASFFLARADRKFDVSEYPHLAWSWKALTLPKGGDVRKSSLSPFAENKNDQALQLLITFDNGDVLSYMWDTTAPVGTEVKEQNPFVNIMAVVVEAGEDHLGAWRSYERNLADDYRRLHAGKARSVHAIAVQTNANHTSSAGEGYFGPIVVSKSNATCLP